MKHIGVISDTHDYLDLNVFKHFEGCDEIWHAGDFGSMEVSEKLTEFKLLKGVYGNIDGEDIKKIHPLDQRFVCEGLDVWITHIGGYPGKYDKRVKEILSVKAPDIFICGHSHILKVMRDKQMNNMICINPGAAGRAGLHKVRTVITFDIDRQTAQNMQVIELGKKLAL